MTAPPIPHGKGSWLSALLLAGKPWVLVRYRTCSRVTRDLGPPSLGHSSAPYVDSRGLSFEG